jgi:hypothetical protein
MFVDIVQAKVNVKIVARERGKIVARREGHNIWVNFGREYLAKTISPSDGTYTTAVNPAVVRYMGLGIGGDAQAIDIAGTFPTLDTHYPGQNIFDDTVITTATLERPVKVSGTAGVGASAGVWMNSVTAPPTFGGAPITKVEFDTLFTNNDIQLSGAYPSVPLSEIGLFLSSEVASRTSEEVYDYGSPPAFINASTRQKLLAYNTFDPISKTVSVSLEIHWEIQF